MEAVGGKLARLKKKTSIFRLIYSDCCTDGLSVSIITGALIVVVQPGGFKCKELYGVYYVFA